MKPIRAVHAALVFVVLLQISYYHPRLPERVASHFNAAGKPDGWSSRASFFGVYLATIAVVLLVFHALPRTLYWVPDRWINLPRKDYWLAPQRRRETLAILQRWMGWFGAGVLLFLIFVFQLAIQANFADDRAVAGAAFWGILAGFLLFTLGWSVLFLLRFLRVPSA
jgi:uncharacterized membrane protein